jgi:hypothetical protein
MTMTNVKALDAHSPSDDVSFEFARRTDVGVDRHSRVDRRATSPPEHVAESGGQFRGWRFIQEWREFVEFCVRRSSGTDVRVCGPDSRGLSCVTPDADCKAIDVTSASSLIFASCPPAEFAARRSELPYAERSFRSASLVTPRRGSSTSVVMIYARAAQRRREHVCGARSYGLSVERPAVRTPLWSRADDDVTRPATRVRRVLAAVGEV